VTAGIRASLEELERSGLDSRSTEHLVVLCWLVKDDIPIDADELHAARRRAMFVLAAGGDPHRDLGLESVAAERLADELDSGERRRALAEALEALDTSGLPRVAETVRALQEDPGAAWRTLALALLADEIAE
jgi:hypothetical protein